MNDSGDYAAGGGEEAPRRQNRSSSNFQKISKGSIQNIMEETCLKDLCLATKVTRSKALSAGYPIKRILNF